MKKQIELGQLANLFPAPVVLVTSKRGEKENVVTIAWCGVVCSQPPTISISVRPGRYSSELIKGSNEFVVNIPNEKMLAEIDKIGNISGKDVNKFELLGLKKEKAEKVTAPVLADCPIVLECRVKQVIPLGTHDCFIGEVLSARVEEKIMSEKGVDFYRLKPVVLLGPEYWSLGGKIEDYGFSKSQE